MRLCQGKFRWDTGERFFPHRVVGPWNRFPREINGHGRACQSSRNTWTMLLILCLVLGIPVRRKELLILVGPFQLETI